MREAPPAPRRLRSVLAVLAGFAATFILSIAADGVLHLMGQLPELGRPVSDQQLIVPAAYRIAFTILGGYVTAKLAPHRPMPHAWALAWLGLVAGILSFVGYMASSTLGLGPLWYALSIPISAMPAVLMGGWLATRSARPTLSTLE